MTKLKPAIWLTQHDYYSIVINDSSLKRRWVLLGFAESKLVHSIGINILMAAEIVGPIVFEALSIVQVCADGVRTCAVSVVEENLRMGRLDRTYNDSMLSLTGYRTNSYLYLLFLETGSLYLMTIKGYNSMSV